ncbi:hypothetical protein HKCCE3408_16295 [Rhodobacterales bacterium HKCCE3408]|nr:hypothetical protein [Rhodobacterales bacterium HKCCE3408]
MTGILRRAWAAAPGLTAGFAVCVLVAGFFAVRTVLGVIYWADPGHRDQPIAGWMTPRYVAMSWDVPPEVVGEALGLTRDAGRPGPLEEIAAARGTSVEALATELQAAIDAYRAEHRP